MNNVVNEQMAKQFVESVRPANVLDVEQGMRTLFQPIFEQIDNVDFCERFADAFKISFEQAERITQSLSASDVRTLMIVAEKKKKNKPSCRRDEAEEYILKALKGGERLVREIDSGAKSVWISKATLQRAKTKLVKSGVIEYRHISRGQSKGVDCYMCLTERGVHGQL